MAESKFLDSTGLTHLLEKINLKFSKLGHKHTRADITDFAHTHDDRYYTESEVDGKLSGKAASSHTHAAADITSVNATALYGTVPISGGGTGGTTAAQARQNLGITKDIEELQESRITRGTAAPTSSTGGYIYIQYS